MRALRWLILSAAVLALLPAEAAAAGSARSSYTRAVAREQALTSADAPTPSIADLRRLVAAFERIAYIYPTSGYADDALQKAAQVAERIYARTRAGDDRENARRLYAWLAKEYPTSPFARAARASARQLESVPASPRDPATAAAPSTRTAKASQAAVPAPTSPSPAERVAAPVASSARRASVEPPAPAHTPIPLEEAARVAPAREPAAGPTPAAPVLRDVRRAVLPEVVRITMELDGEVGYQHERLEGPARLFFDLKGTVPAPHLRDTVLSWPDDVVRQVRLGRPAPGTTRVVLDLEGTRRYSVFTLYNPYRVVVDLERAAGTVAGLRPSVPPPSVAPAASAHADAPSALLADLDLEPAPAAPPVDPREIDGRDQRLAEDVTLAGRDAPATSTSIATSTRGAAPSTAAPSKAATPAAVPAPPVQVPRPPTANASGGFSLSRQLGLGVSRIVIDPGHGGRDPGAQANGLSEADLVLDVALRLEALLSKQPGVDVVLTRRTDTYVALEERTAIANREQADLFLSIHANASRNKQAHGVETYFLNFATSPEAEAVAARENSASERTMHNLPDIVKAIATNNKLHESRDFAGMVQESMVRRLSNRSRPVRNLGVKQAPFVVLIGAGMPSVLAEISFLTNAREAQLLKQSSYRQRIAEALYDAVVKYQRSLKSVGTVAEQ